MVYLHFPSNLTDEELMVQTKYSKLRKKKKALTDMKAPKVEPEKINLLKRPLDPKDAKELAKKLVQAGKVNIPKKPMIERTTFKRSRTFERKIGMTPRSDVGYGTSGQESAPILPAFEPFSPAPGNGGMDKEDNNPMKSMGGSSQLNSFTIPSTGGGGGKSRFNSYRSANFGEGRHEGNGPHDHGPNRHGPNTFNKPKRGPTLYIHGHGITEQFLKDVCGKFGKVMIVKPNSATKFFVTFDKVESAETCVTELNGTTQDDILLEVQFARRQPAITGGNDSVASASWQALATSQSQKGAHQDKRAAIIYD